MKRFATKTLVMTAALAALAVGASAQSMKAEIPFGFRAGDALLAAGSYQVYSSHGANGSAMIRLFNSDTKKGVLLVPHYGTDVPKASSREPKLWFACGGPNCVLTTLWNGEDRSALVVGSPARAGKEMAETRVVSMTAVKSE